MQYNDSFKETTQSIVDNFPNFLCLGLLDVYSNLDIFLNDSAQFISMNNLNISLK